MERKNPNDWTNRTVIFTASNKGIGFASIVNILQKGKYSKIIMTSRSEDKARKAMELLVKKVGQEKAAKVTYYILDLESEGSIAAFVQQIKEH